MKTLNRCLFALIALFFSFSACKKAEQAQDTAVLPLQTCVIESYFENPFPTPSYNFKRTADNLITQISVITGRHYDAGTFTYLRYEKVGQQISKIDVHYVDKFRGAEYTEDSTITDYSLEFDAQELLKKVWIKTAKDAQKRLLNEYSYQNNTLSSCKVYNDTGGFIIRNYTYQQGVLNNWTQNSGTSSDESCQFEFYADQSRPASTLALIESYFLGLTLPRYTSFSIFLPTATQQAIFGHKLPKRVISYHPSGNKSIGLKYELDTNNNLKRLSFAVESFTQNSPPPFASDSVFSNQNSYAFYYYTCK
ncbi:MAG: hypothetical protein U0Y10_11160 [Spirosomataceae bacterium]